MVILALETVTRNGSLACYADGAWIVEAGSGTRTHGTRLPGALEGIAARASRTLRDVDVLAVVTGPGSFTGLRIGLAAVQGVALSLGRPVVGVPTFEALAEAWRAAHAGESVRLVMAIDGARGDVYFAAADVGAAGVEFRVPASVADPHTAARRLSDEPADRPVVLLGDAVDRYRAIWDAAFREVRIDAMPDSLALGAGLLALANPARAGAPHHLRPLYVRRPDAELARDRAREAAGSP